MTVYSLRTHRRMAFRPLLVGTAIAFIAISLGLLFNSADRMALPALFAPAIMVATLGAVRAGIWLLVAGQSTLTIGGGIVTLKSRNRCLEFSTESIRSIVIIAGDARPELSRWATLPRIAVETNHGGKAGVKILLPDGTIEALNHEIEDALSR